jgi:hypothetical protein
MALDDLPIHFAVPVWGDEYLRTFLTFSLPSQLASGNIPFLAADGRHIYTVYTTHEDAARLRASDTFRALERHLPTTIEIIDIGRVAGGKYAIKSDCYRSALQKAADHRAAVFLLNADIVLADGFVRGIARLLAAGKRVIEVPGPRGLRSAIGRALYARYRSADGITITIDPLQLSSLWMRHMHPQLEMHFVEGEAGEPFHPSHFYWELGDVGIIARCFHLYPIVVVPAGSQVNFSTTIDDDLVRNLGVPRDQMAIVRDSTEIFCCELSPLDLDVGAPTRRGDIAAYLAFFNYYGGDHNIDNLAEEILISSTAALGEEWVDRRRTARQFCQEVTALYQSRAVEEPHAHRPASPPPPPDDRPRDQTVAATSTRKLIREIIRRARAKFL